MIKIIKKKYPASINFNLSKILHIIILNKTLSKLFSYKVFKNNIIFLIKNLINKEIFKNLLFNIFIKDKNIFRSKKILVAVINFLILFNFEINYLYSQEAKHNGIGRVRNCEDTGGGVIKTEDMQGMDLVNPKDIEFQMQNPVCIAIVVSSYVDVKASIAVMNGVCGSGSVIPRIYPSPFLDAIDLARAAPKAITNYACGTAYANALRSFTTVFYSFATVNGIAQSKFKNVKLCGAGWKIPNPVDYIVNTPGYEQELQNRISTMVNEGSANLNMSNQDYRQFYFGGKEFEDKTDQGDICRDATQEKDGSGNYPPQKYYLRGSLPGNYNCQRFLIASGQDKNGAKLSVERIKEIKASYDCCVRRSKEYVCIEENDSMAIRNYTFCKAGTRCSFNAITYETWYENNQRQICVKSYSLCPYNFTLNGGTNVCQKFCDGVYEDNTCRLPKDLKNTRYLNNQEYNELIKNGTCGKESGVFTAAGTPISEVRESDCSLNEKANKCRNYCQYMSHCTVAIDNAIKPPSSITSPFFAQACIDFVGDSKNMSVYDGGIAGNFTNFSAPIAQCFKETMENLFFNRVGHSRCSSQTEIPTTNGECNANGSGDQSYLTGNGFVYRAGSSVGPLSIFGNIQQKLQIVIKLFLTLSVVFFGYNVLMARMDLTDKKGIMIYILKFAIICFFSLGTAWQGFFFNGVYGASGELGLMVFKIKTPFGITTQNKMDGCQFGVITSESGEILNNEDVDGVNKKIYPPGKQYLAMWDTLDCKIAKYLGIGVKGSVANITILILASLFTGPIGIYFCLMVLIFGIMLIVMTIHALHIFICSSISIIIFVFISPIIFPMMLFEKTKSIFDAWFKEIFGFCLAPMFLFAYIGFAISAMDMTLVGSATFIGNNPRSLNCQKYCIKADGTFEKDTTKCLDPRDIIVDPLDDSVLCLINTDNNSFSSYPGLEIIGVSIIALKNLFSDPAKIHMRILTILKAVLVIFLLYKFMDEIPGIASQISGGTEMSLTEADAFKVFKNLARYTKGFVERARRGSIKFGKYLKDGSKNKKDSEENK